MKLRIDIRKWLSVAVVACTAIVGKAQSVSESNPDQWYAIGEGNSIINSKEEKQTKEIEVTGALMVTMNAEFNQIKKWQKQYNDYLKTARGYAEQLKAGTSLYMEGLIAFRNLRNIQRAIDYNPVGIGATIPMNNLYIETAIELVKIYMLLKQSVAQGGAKNMLNAAERTELLWSLNDSMAELNKKLRQLAISIAFYNLSDVWQKATEGMVEKTHGQIAGEAFDRWKRIQKIQMVLK